jgi:phosphatidylglycerophosphate synthase
MFDQLARPVKEKLLIPIVKRWGTKLSPNFVTLAAFIPGIVSVILILQGKLNAALVCWILNRVLDGVDGTLARVNGKQSDFGGFLDLILDFIIYAAIPTALFFYAAQQQKPAEIILSGLSLAILLGSFYVNTVSWMMPSVLIEKKFQSSEKLTSIEMPSSLIEGMETIVFYCLFMLFPGYLKELFWFMSGLIWISILHKVFWVWRKF